MINFSTKVVNESLNKRAKLKPCGAWGNTEQAEDCPKFQTKEDLD
jgi:hypothetical protein